MSVFARKVILNTPNSNSEDFAASLAALDRRLSLLEGSLLRPVPALATCSVAITASKK